MLYNITVILVGIFMSAFEFLSRIDSGQSNPEIPYYESKTGHKVGYVEMSDIKLGPTL